MARFCCTLARWPCESNRGNISEHPSFDRNGSYFLDLSTDNWIKPDKQEYLKVTITSHHNIHFNINETFHTFLLCFASSHPLERKRSSFSAFLLIRFPNWERKNWWVEHVLNASANYSLLTGVLVTSVCDLKDSLYKQLDAVRVFYSLQISCNSAVLTKGFCLMEWDHCRKIHASL